VGGGYSRGRGARIKSEKKTDLGIGEVNRAKDPNKNRRSKSLDTLEGGGGGERIRINQEISNLEGITNKPKILQDYVHSVIINGALHRPSISILRGGIKILSKRVVFFLQKGRGKVHVHQRVRTCGLP